MNNINIRLEEKKDWNEVECLTRAAFWREERIGKIGVGAVEHFMVHKMRGKEGVKALTFVAEMDDRIVGHIIYSEGSHILQPSGEKKSVLNFGPISVVPKYQKQGVGSALMIHSIQMARKLGYGGIVFFGHPTYYPRFGFKEAKTFNITTAEGHNFPAFMAMELQKGYFDDVSGKFIDTPIYNEDLTKGPAKEYDRGFENKDGGE